MGYVYYGENLNTTMSSSIWINLKNSIKISTIRTLFKQVSVWIVANTGALWLPHTPHNTSQTLTYPLVDNDELKLNEAA